MDFLHAQDYSFTVAIWTIRVQWTKKKNRKCQLKQSVSEGGHLKERIEESLDQFSLQVEVGHYLHLIHPLVQKIPNQDEREKNPHEESLDIREIDVKGRGNHREGQEAEVLPVRMTAIAVIVVKGKREGKSPNQEIGLIGNLQSLQKQMMKRNILLVW